MIGLAIFLFFILILAQYLNIKDIRSAIENRNEVITQKKEILAKISLLKEQYTARSGDIQRLSVLVPKSKKLEEIVSSLDSLSQQSGLELRNLVTGVREASKEESRKTIFTEVNLAGQYPAFFNFLHLLEKNLRIFDVKEIGAVKEVSSPGGILNFKLNFETYFVE